MRFAMENGQICFLLRKFLAMSSAIQKIASNCGCDAVVHLSPEETPPLNAFFLNPSKRGANKNPKNLKKHYVSNGHNPKDSNFLKKTTYTTHKQEQKKTR